MENKSMGFIGFSVLLIVGLVFVSEAVKSVYGTAESIDSETLSDSNEFVMTSTLRSLSPFGEGVITSTVTTPNQTWINLNASGRVTIPDNDKYSPSEFGNQTTISFWFYMNNFSFTGDDADSHYTNYLAKYDYPGGATGNQVEWVFRMYNSSGVDSSSTRPCRMSFYAFNRTGGLGAGSFFQDNSTADSCPTMNNTWIHIVGRINGTHVAIFKNGVLRDTDPLSGYGIVLENSNASINIGIDEDGAFWGGMVDDLKVYNRSLSNAEINQTYLGGRNNITISTGLVGYWRMNENSGSKLYDSIYSNNGTFVGGAYINDEIDQILTNNLEYNVSTDTFNLIDSKYLYSYIDIDYSYNQETSDGVRNATVLRLAGIIILCGLLYFIFIYIKENLGWIN